MTATRKLFLAPDEMSKAVKAQDVQKLSAVTQSFAAEGKKLVAAEEALRAAVGSCAQTLSGRPRVR